MSVVPLLYEECEVLERLELRGYELDGLLDVGSIAPVACGAGGRPMYCAETIDRMATRGERDRLSDLLWWDFDLKRPSFLPADTPWARAVDLPFYPFDDEEQQAWARRYYKLKKACAPGPYPDPGRLARRRLKLEAEATKAFERKHGIKRPRKSRDIDVRIRGTDVKISRAKLRDLAWSKTMIRAAADLGISECALRRLCKRQLIPLPTRGHFNHQDLSRAMENCPLGATRNCPSLGSQGESK
ncbi:MULTISPECIES: hypothetical protein [unclassified Bradyrhizobium]|uniref:hypothetical protein n=1 Tax=unclassified Bradyrhizobium TaxID=2631580 RepID=UPI001FFAF0B1|nr:MULTISPECIES: hypothetical protein [unclassified Bradyrhizobium]MCK1534652.1 hypothetical protein [Bradyrhizobium sp. 176]MCK1557889.1 hypothetical protein [Bradyrhizobium sp. 171]UPJ98261.1 hypothetical protein IVB07_12570 [Bradyrhizobium sp. 172]